MLAAWALLSPILTATVLTYAGPQPTVPVADPSTATADTATEGSSATPWIQRHLPQAQRWELGTFVGAAFLSRNHDFYDPSLGGQHRLGRAGPEAGVRAAYYPLSFLGVEAEFGGIWTRLRDEGIPAFVYGLRGHVVAQLPLYRVAPFIVGGYGLMGIRSDRDVLGNDLDPVGHYGLGVKLFADRRFTVRLEGRHLLGAATARRIAVAHHFAVQLGLGIRLGRTPSPPAPVVEGPPPDLDQDDDGLIDSEDRCPREPGTTPDGCAPPDFDQDGVIDLEDACPKQAGPLPQGCPDLDGDGMVGAADRCPEEPETLNGFEDGDGCADVIPPPPLPPAPVGSDPPSTEDRSPE